MNHRNRKFKKEIKQKMKKRQVFRDLHPNWDRFRGTLLYPLNCGELAMNTDEWRVNFNNKYNDWSTYCEEQVHKDCVENSVL